MSTYKQYINDEKNQNKILFQSRHATDILFNIPPCFSRHSDNYRNKSEQEELDQKRKEIFESKQYKQLALQLDKPLIEIVEKPKKVINQKLANKIKQIQNHQEPENKIRELSHLYKEELRFAENGYNGNYPEYQQRLNDVRKNAEFENQSQLSSKYGMRTEQPDNYDRPDFVVNPHQKYKQPKQLMKATSVFNPHDTQTKQKEHKEPQQASESERIEQQKEFDEYVDAKLKYQELQNKYLVQQQIEQQIAENQDAFTQQQKQQKQQPKKNDQLSQQHIKNTPKKSVRFDNNQESDQNELKNETSFQSPKTQSSNKFPYSVPSSQQASHFAKEVPLQQSAFSQIIKEDDLTLEDFYDVKKQNVLVNSDNAKKESPLKSANQIFREDIDKLAEIDENAQNLEKQKEDDIIIQLKQQNELLLKQIQITQENQNKQMLEQQELKQQLQSIQQQQITNNQLDQPSVALNNNYDAYQPDLEQQELQKVPSQESFQTAQYIQQNTSIEPPSMLLTPGGPMASVIRTVQPQIEQSQISQISQIFSNQNKYKQISPQQQYTKNEILSFIRAQNQFNEQSSNNNAGSLQISDYDAHKIKQEKKEYLNQKQSVLDIFKIKINTNIDQPEQKIKPRKQGFITMQQQQQTQYQDIFIDQQQKEERELQNEMKAAHRSKYAKFINSKADQSRTVNNRKFDDQIEKAKLIEQKYREYLVQRYCK